MMSISMVNRPVQGCVVMMAAVALAVAGIAPPAAAYELQEPASMLALVEGDNPLETPTSLETLTAPTVEAADCDFECVSDCEPRCGGQSSCGRSGFLIAGVEATFLTPDFGGTPVTFTANNIGAATTSLFSSSVDGLDNTYVGPRVWVGVQGECWGVVGRFWQLADSQFASDPLMPGETTGFVASQRFDAYTADLELTRGFYLGNSKIDLAVGARYASIDYGSTLSAYELVGIDLLSATASARHQFGGTGFTFGLGGRRPIRFGCGANLSLIWNLRGSVLWGDFTNSAEAAATYSGAGGAAYAIDGALARTSDDVFIGEAQLGFQYERELRHLPANAFIRLVGEYQGWDGSGATAFAGAGVLAPGIASGITTATSSDARMDLVGFTIGTGLTW